MRLTPSPYFLTTANIFYVLSMFLGSSPVQSNPCLRPSNLTCYVGESAQFRWNTVRNSTILSATWGIKKGNIADPHFINVDIMSSKVNLNSGLKPDLIKRLSFDGDLKTGRAWFTLKNVTVKDANVYLASISDDVTRVLPYTAALHVNVKEQEHSEPTKRTGPTSFPQNAKEPYTYTKDLNVKEAVYSNDHKPRTSVAVLVAELVLLSLTTDD